MTDHPITPPPELERRWIDNAHLSQPNMGAICHEVATQAAQWGWDQRNKTIEAELQEARDVELEGCCEWVVKTIPSWAPHTLDEQLRAARRPKPPSLKEQALRAIGSPSRVGEARVIEHREHELIRRALEALDD